MIFTVYETYQEWEAVVKSRGGHISPSKEMDEDVLVTNLKGADSASVWYLDPQHGGYGVISSEAPL